MSLLLLSSTFCAVMLTFVIRASFLFFFLSSSPDSLVDDSDPDTELSQTQHALQTAEAIRAKYPGEEYDWFHLTGLIHDLGKILAISCKEPQWCTVGDTFPVGCAFSDKSVFPQYFDANPDRTDPRYNTELGVYEPHCGLEKVKMSWGHDEYLYQVCVRNGSTLPIEGLYMIRFHSFYPSANTLSHRRNNVAASLRNIALRSRRERNCSRMSLVVPYVCVLFIFQLAQQGCLQASDEREGRVVVGMGAQVQSS
jgi:hypothetical protein